jgi:DNA repair protein RecO (recombination protein O)
MASPKAGRQRVQDEPAFVLHRHDWSESSLILEVFSQRFGRLALVAKGVKRPTSQYRAVLLPLQPLRLSWSGDAEVRSLRSAHWQGGHLMPQGDALLAGCYLNELLLKLLARDDPHPRLFVHYTEAVAALAQGVPQAAVLRAFELLLLQAAGLLPALDQEGASLQALHPQAQYCLSPEHGLQPQIDPRQPACVGGRWTAWQQAMGEEAPLQALCRLMSPDSAAALRRQLRDVLHYHCGVGVFQTRQLLADVQHLADRPR